MRSGDAMSMGPEAEAVTSVQPARVRSRKQGAPRRAVNLVPGEDVQGDGREALTLPTQDQPAQHEAAPPWPAAGQHGEPSRPAEAAAQPNSTSPIQQRPFVVPTALFAAAPGLRRVVLQLIVHGSVQYTCKASALLAALCSLALLNCPVPVS